MSATAQFDNLGNLFATVSPATSSPAPAGVTFLHYDETKVALPMVTTLVAATALVNVAGGPIAAPTPK